MSSIRQGHTKLRLVCLALFAVVTISGCGGDGAPSKGPAVAAATDGRAKALDVTPATSPDVSVVSLVKVSETRVSRTIYDYVFKAVIRNGPTPQTALMATVVGAGPGTVVLDGSILVGDLTAGSTLTPTDTITLRHDRSVPFSSAGLIWNITEPINGIAVPPEPNSTANQSTLAGVDSDGDGIRDDIERKIAAGFGSNGAEYLTAVNHAKSLQLALVSPGDLTAISHVELVACVDRSILDRLMATTISTLDTPKRRLAYGDAFSGIEITDAGCVK